jgi:enoyl-CoA hydratase/carnithine racemase
MGNIEPPVLYEQNGHVVTITYNRPERMNAINGDLRNHLNDAWLRFRDDEDAWVAILTGNGRAFSSGADIKDGAGSVGTFAGTYWEKPTINSFESGLELFKPVIAAINGPCLGYGLTAVTFADFTIAGDSATFGFPEVRLGVPTIVGAIRLPERIGWQNAMELLLIGETVDAERAKELGLVWKVVDDDALMPEARALADRLCLSAPLAVRATKEVAVRSRSMPWIESVRFGETMRKVAGATEDAAEGMAAGRDRRRPEWRGR